jgi:hypothetical protein
MGLSIQGEYDPETGVWRPYTLEEKQAKIKEVYGKNTLATRQVLAREQDNIEEKGMIKEQHLRNQRSIMILGAPTRTPDQRRRR